MDHYHCLLHHHQDHNGILLTRFMSWVTSQMSIVSILWNAILIKNNILIRQLQCSGCLNICVTHMLDIHMIMKLVYLLKMTISNTFCWLWVDRVHFHVLMRCWCTVTQCKHVVYYSPPNVHIYSLLAEQLCCSVMSPLV
jgi:hypothetical protein